MTSGCLAITFAGWCSSLTASAIPADVSEAAEAAMMDTLGVMLAGGGHPDVQKLAKAFAMEGSVPLAAGGFADAPTACLLNGMAAHVLDFDDTSYTGIMHGSAIVYSVVSSLAAELDSSHTSTRTAFVAGSEIAYTLADICTHKHYFEGWWSSATLGLIGSTAAACKLLELNADRTATALGLAASSAGGSKSIFGTAAKPFLLGETARRALTFARFAEAGLDGPKMAFESETGFLNLLAPKAEEVSDIDPLGSRWRLVDPGLAVKLHPVCSAAQAAIEQTALLVDDNDISAEQIDKISAEVPHLVRISLVHDRPSSPAEAQFSLPFAVACSVLEGSVSLNALSEEYLRRKDLRDLMERVIITETTHGGDIMADIHPESAFIKIVLKDGRAFSGFCGSASGMPDRPLSKDKTDAKFSSCVNYRGGQNNKKTPPSADLFRPIAGTKTGEEITEPTKRRVS